MASAWGSSWGTSWFDSWLADAVVPVASTEASAWGSSWGTSWLDSWLADAVVPVASTDRGDGARSRHSPAERKRRKARYVRNRHFVIREPRPLEPGPGEEPRRVTAAIIDEAIAQTPDWFGTRAQARQAVPKTIPLMVPPLDQWSQAEKIQLVEAARVYLLQAMREFEAAQDEDDIEMLLLAA